MAGPLPLWAQGGATQFLPTAGGAYVLLFAMCAAGDCRVPACLAHLHDLTASTYRRARGLVPTASPLAHIAKGAMNLFRCF